MKKHIFYIRMILASLMRRKSRMLVALLAVAIGSTILSGLLTIYYDVPRQMGREFRNYGANLIVLPKDNEKKIDFDELERLRGILPEDKVVGLAPFSYQAAKINEQPTMIAATSLDDAKVNNPYWLIQGEWPEKENEVLLGHEIAKTVGLKPGDSFTLMTVKDENKAKDSSDDKRSEGGISTIDLDKNMTKKVLVMTGEVITGGAEEAFVFMSFEDLAALVPDRAGRIDVLECSLEADGEELSSIAEDIHQKEPSLVPRLAQRLTASQDTVLQKLQALVWLVTIIVLVLTMISVSTTMMAVVVERRNEIGLKKALGASHQEVVREFLGEGVVLGLVGGLLGAIFGFYFAQEVSVSVFSRAIQFHLGLGPLTVVVATAMTVVSCWFPVRQTINIEPALVLKGE